MFVCGFFLLRSSFPHFEVVCWQNKLEARKFLGVEIHDLSTRYRHLCKSPKPSIAWPRFTTNKCETKKEHRQPEQYTFEMSTGKHFATGKFKCSNGNWWIATYFQFKPNLSMSSFLLFAAIEFDAIDIWCLSPVRANYKVPANQYIRSNNGHDMFFQWNLLFFYHQFPFRERNGAHHSRQ